MNANLKKIVESIALSALCFTFTGDCMGATPGGDMSRLQKRAPGMPLVCKEGEEVMDVLVHSSLNLHKAQAAEITELHLNERNALILIDGSEQETYTNLKVLVLEGLTIYPWYLDKIHALPALKKVRFVDCDVSTDCPDIGEKLHQLFKKGGIPDEQAPCHINPLADFWIPKR